MVKERIGSLAMVDPAIFLGLSNPGFQALHARTPSLQSSER